MIQFNQNKPPCKRKEAKTLSETLSQTSNLTKLLFMDSCYEVSTCQKFNCFKQQSVN